MANLIVVPAGLPTPGADTAAVTRFFAGWLLWLVWLVWYGVALLAVGGC